MNDLEFLQELKENIILGVADITRHEMALTMVDDWIDELEHEKQQAVAAERKNRAR